MRVRLYFLLATLAMLGPLSLDLYLPALPAMARELGAPESALQLTLTGCLIGLALGQIGGGPLSDSLGRRRPLLAGLLLYALVSAAIALPVPLRELIVLRLLQGMAGGCALVIGTATVRDLYTGAAAVRFFSMLLMVSGLSPILAPALGGQLLLLLPWRGLFGVLAGCALALVCSIGLGLPETLPPERRRRMAALTPVSGIVALAREAAFMRHAIAVGLSTGAVLAYISASSFVIQGIYGASPQLFGALFAVNGLALVAGSQLSAFLVGKLTPTTLLRIGLGGSLASSFILLLVVVAGRGAGLVAFMIPVLFLVASNAMIGPNGNALALAPHPEKAGAAAALVGVLRFGSGAALAPVVGLLGPDSALPLALVAVSAGLLGAGAYWSLGRRAHRSEPAV